MLSDHKGETVHLMQSFCNNQCKPNCDETHARIRKRFKSDPDKVAKRKIEQAEQKVQQEKLNKAIKHQTLSNRELILSAGKHALIVGKYALKHGKILASDQETKRRVAICETNECGKYNKENKSCKICGCGLNAARNMAKFIAIPCSDKDNPLW